MTTALAQRQDLLPDASKLKTMMELAGQLVQSGLLPTAIKSPAAALAIIQKGQELGIPPMYALSNIGIINGKPVVGAEVMLAMVYRDHGDQAVQFEEANDQRCSAVYKRRGWPQYRRFEWTIEDAEKAGLLGKGGPWKQYPGAMLRARCVSALARLAFPDSIGGMYTAEELGAEVMVTDDGGIEVVHAAAPVVTIVPKTADITPPPTVAAEPADEVTRAKFEANWTKGTARAIACGVAPDEKPGADATKNDLRKAQTELLQAIQARETLNAALLEKIALANEHNADFKVPDPSQKTDAEIHEEIAACDRILDAAEQADDSEAF